MKVLLILMALLAATISGPTVKTWTFPELVFHTGNYSEKKTAEQMDYLEDAKFEIANKLASINGSAAIVIPSPSGRPTWTVQELEDQKPKPIENYFNMSEIQSSEEAREFAKGHAISLAYNLHLENVRRFKPQKYIEVKEPGIDISRWSIKDLKEALKNPKTHPDLLPYLRDAFSVLMGYMRSGFRNESVVVLTPLGLIPHTHNLHVKRKTTQKPLTTTTKKIITRHAKGWGVRM